MERTTGKLRRSNNNWKNMRQHVVRFIISVVCVVKRCQPLSRQCGFGLYTLSKYSMGECIYMDYIEGLIPDEYGYTSILVMIDRCLFTVGGVVSH